MEEVTNAFRQSSVSGPLISFIGYVLAMGVSPMPFGSHPFQDKLFVADFGFDCRTVTNAFRQSSVSGRDVRLGKRYSTSW